MSFFIGWLNFLPPVNTAPGDLDTIFSQDGKLFDFLSFGGLDGIYGTAIQTDGKIVAAGQAYFGEVESCGISRYNTDGTLDATFDGDGRAIIPAGVKFICRSVAIQPDGKIVAADYTGNSTNDDFAVVRFNTDGSLDTSFDSDGKVTTPVLNTADQANAVAIQTNGKILVAGNAVGNGFLNSDFALVRYNANGSLDTTFNTDGKVIFDFWGLSNDLFTAWHSTQTAEPSWSVKQAKTSLSPECLQTLCRMRKHRSILTATDERN